MASHIQTLQNLSNWNLPLRIHRRGSFFSDEGFSDFRRYFELAAQDLFQEFDVMKTEDSFKSYRKLRDRHLSGTDRAAKIAEEKDKYKIVLDVEGFNDSDLQVKVAGPNEIVVEGRQEFKNGGTFSNRSFRRLFSLPGLALIQEATSVLSSDNVLTINVPKKIQEITNESEASFLNTTQAATSDSKKIENIQESFQKSQENSSNIIPDVFSTPSLANNKFWDLQIVPKQSFFNDSFFENVRHNFQRSVDEVMQRMQRRMNNVDVGLVRKVRETKDETNVQAISVTEDSKEHKVVLDVHGFSEGDLKVRAISESELIVEGKVEKKTDCTSCSHTFRKNLQFPSNVNIKEATSALSSEGILTINIPKKVEAIDYQIPVKTEAASHITNVIKQEQSKSSNTANTVREQIVPVVQEDVQMLNKSQLNSENSTLNTTTSQSTNYGSANSQILLDKLERTVQMCDDIDNRKPVVGPSTFEVNQVSKIKEENSAKNVISSEPSELIKESQKIVNESAKLIKDIGSTDQSANKEHYVPVEVDAGINISSNSNITNTQQSSQTRNVSTSHSSKTPRVIPVSLKGSFYNESIFDDARKTIDNEVKDAFTKYRQSSLVDESVQKTDVQKSETDSSALIKSGQTSSTMIDDVHNYKIVVDVYGFQEKELKVSLSGLNEISVEGNSERSKDGSIAKHSFQRTFQLPDNIDLERSSTALSEEGILTITVPKKNQLLLHKISLPSSSRMEKETKAQEERKTLVIDSSGIVQETKNESHPSVAQNIQSHTQSSHVNTQSSQGVLQNNQTQSSQINSQTSQTVTQNTQGDKREFIVPLNVEETSDVASEVSSVRSTSDLSSQMSTSSITSKDLSQDISASTSCSSVNTQVNVPIKENTDKVIEVQGLDSLAKNTATSRDIVTRTLFDLPIVSRGYFFDDNFFQDSRSMFESILRNKMNRFNRSTSFVDDLGFFKSLRENKLTSGNQMATFSEDDQFNKIVLDVHGFSENDLKIRVLAENEILIEGSVEEKAGSSMSKKTFRKHFVLPGSVDLKGASSALSSDGVLNIKIPKRA